MVQYLSQNIPSKGKHISRLIKEYQTCNLEAVIVIKCNKIIAAIIHDATVLQKADVCRLTVIWSEK
jgi:hypothetical protein